jgi:hypothetical protein
VPVVARRHTTPRIGNPKELRMEAARCLLLAAKSATSLETREEFIALAHIGLDRDNPLVPLHHRMRAFDRDPIRGGHYGQRSCEPR